MSEYFSAEAQERTKKAIDKARAKMDAEGHEYPCFPKYKGPALLDAIEAYRRKESAYIVEFLKTPSGPRPIALDTVKTPKPAAPRTNQWGRPYYTEE